MTIKLTGSWAKTARMTLNIARLDFKSLHREIGEYILNDTRDRFETGRGPDGVRWPKSGRVMQRGGQTLVHKRRLEGSLTFKALTNRVHVGTNDKRARIHQLGGKIKPKSKKYLRFKIGNQWVTVRSVTIPARPYLGLNRRNNRQIANIIKKRIGDEVRD